MKQFSFLTIGLFLGTMALNTSTFAQQEQSSTQALTPAQVEAVKKVVHDYLIASPEVLIEASKSLQEQQKQKMQVDAEKGITKNFKKLISSKTSPVVGNPSGDVVLVVFSDYRCVHCKSMAKVVEGLAEKNKDLMVVVKELPIFGAESELAAKAALASQKQGKFFNFHKELFNSKVRLSEKSIMELAKASKLDEKQLRQDMNDPAVKQELADNIKLAGELKLPGTPAFLIVNKSGSGMAFVPGAVPDPEKVFQELIEKARKSK